VKCAEEASLPVEYARENITACGVLFKSENADRPCPGGVSTLNPVFIRDGDVVQVPNDGETQEPNLTCLEEVVDAL
jgi:hypothetical protein